MSTQSKSLILDSLNSNGQKRIRKSSVKTLDLGQLAFSKSDYEMLEKFWHDYHHDCVSLEEAVKKIVMADLKKLIGIMKIYNIYKKRRASEKLDDILNDCRNKGLPIADVEPSVRQMQNEWLNRKRALVEQLKKGQHEGTLSEDNLELNIA